ncbi:MAG: sulfatase-like hydrolase/transferase, partial [Acidobacteriota bacterium]
MHALDVRARPRAVLCLTLALLSGCGGDEAPFAKPVRWIVEPTDQVLDLAGVRKSFGYELWSFESAAEHTIWRSPDPVILSEEDGMLKVPATGTRGQFVRLSREVDLRAENVAALVVRASGVGPGRLRLFWAGPGQGFVSERGVRVDFDGPPVGEEGELQTYRLELAGHELWQGRIRGIRLDVPDVAGRVVRLASVATIGGGDYEARMLAGLVAQDWKLTLADEARDAMLSPPGVEGRWTLPSPTRGVLRFAFGLPRGSGPAVTFRVSDASAGQLFEETIDPQVDGQADRWHEAAVELPAAASELVFETAVATAGAGAADYQLDDGIPAWGSPEIRPSGGGVKPPNVVLISVDTLRADRLGVYGYGNPTSPHIDRWARERGVVFRRAVTTAPWTLPSHVSMLSGLD